MTSNTKEKKNSGLSEWRRMLWPIEGYEHKKFLPMALMMFCILLNYSTLRSIKDGFIVTGIGAEALGFLKMYVVFPSSMIAMILYIKLCDVLSTKNVFYAITWFFIGYFLLFAFVLYPNQTLVHPDPECIDCLAKEYKTFQWFIRIWGKWSMATFYVMSELWGSMMLSLLFWQFANRIVRTDEAKRFYSMFGLLANCSLFVTSAVINFFLDPNRQFVAPEIKFLPLIIVVIISALLVIFIYSWMQSNVLKDPKLYSPEQQGGGKKKKVKLSLIESFKMIFSSAYLGLIAALVVAYGVSIILVEGVWKDKIKTLYPNAEEYTMYMGKFQMFQGFGSIICMIIGANVLRKLPWKVAALVTPLIMLVTGMIFFNLIFFEEEISPYLAFLQSTPLAIAVSVGMIQNVLGKSVKYSLFDSTKNMAYIPLDTDLKTKGQAAVEVVGGRLGKSGGALISSTFFLLAPSLSFSQATPYFGCIFFGIVVVWIYAVIALSIKYEEKIKMQSAEEKGV
ncbi:NTP/NDP exchange transporter Tlc1 [Rickettsiales endosymbiont of Paramecium tredecaurelia]|uniref:Npt1/Npt2 family nucleotide transporter n=1 Tax=Candidatus Sarmatiella mevalonica TaxID=2770581 RepID=UPI00192407FC|nr:Npt1/Npt2 family nucleotide transporter [Candidatus Sarmatiella mevalonica]MBL3284247.1 NTP/NDP exchange transporter Tlc1 [Candidatus Sarmatiella mevalonica]